MSPESARQVTQGMEFVVQHGSGFKAQIAHVAVAGKTGTAASGAYFPHAWFIAFAPASHPVIAVAVLHEFSGEGFKFAAPIARKVMIAALQEAGYHVH
jgi:peptidoglycan glycosyltransferase